MASLATCPIYYSGDDILFFTLESTSNQMTLCLTSGCNKDKAIPIAGREMSKIHTSYTKDSKMAMKLADLPLTPPPKRHSVLISVPEWVDPRAIMGIRYVLEYADIIGNRSRDLETCSVVPQPITLSVLQHLGVGFLQHSMMHRSDATVMLVFRHQKPRVPRPTAPTCIYLHFVISAIAPSLQLITRCST
jgi:hypothetical protein